MLPQHLRGSQKVLHFDGAKPCPKFVPKNQTEHGKYFSSGLTNLLICIGLPLLSLTIYDMCKAVDRGMTMTGVRLVEKMGGKSGRWTA